MLSIAITTLFRGLSNRENIVAFTAPNAHTNGATPSSFAPRFLSPAVIINSEHALKSVASVSESRITSSKPSTHGPHKGPSFVSVVYYEEWRLIDIVIQQTARKSTGGSSSSLLMRTCF